MNLKVKNRFQNNEPASDSQYLLATECYDLTFGNRPDIKFYTDVAKEIGGPVLDVGCGTGRVLIPIAKQGIEIMGIDLSEPWLLECKRKIEAIDSKYQQLVSLAQFNLVDFRIDNKFKLIIMPFRVFQHVLDSKSQLQTLENLRAHLVDNGRLVFDIYNPSIPMLADKNMLKEFRTDNRMRGKNKEVFEVWEKVVERNYNEQTLSAQEIYIVKRNNGKKERSVVNYTVRYTFRYEMEHLLNLAGFELEHLFSDFERTVFGDSYPGDLVIFAKKKD